MKEQVAFLHIPKSGGTSFRHLLGATFGKNACHYFDSTRIEESVTEFRDDANLSALIGHFGWGISALKNRKRIWVTFLRSPTRRCASYWNHIQMLPPEIAARTVGMKGISHNNIPEISLATAIESRASWVLDNAMVRQLACDDGIPLDYRRCPVVSRVEYQKAETRLREVVFPGLTEQYELSLALIQSILRKSSIDLDLNKYLFLRKSKNPLTFDDDVEHEAKELNKWDQQLYEIGQDVFETTVAKHADVADLHAVRNYLKEARGDNAGSIRERVLVKIRSLPRKRRVAVFGGGEHTHHLFSDTNLASFCVAVIDSFKEGGSIDGVPVLNIKDLAKVRCDIIVVSSFDFQADICRSLKNVGFSGEIVTLYEPNDTHDYHL